MFLAGNRYTVGILIFTTACMLRFSSSSVTEYIEDARNNIRNQIRHEVRKSRNARDVNNCGNWSPWKNDNHPTSTHKDDREAFTQIEMDKFCPTGSISNFECRDDNGEPFSHKNVTASDTDGSHSISCYDIHVGVICTVLDSKTTKCPDLSIRYQCSCTNVKQQVTVPAVPIGTVTHKSVQFGVDTTVAPVGVVTPNPVPPVVVVTTPVGLVTTNPVPSIVDLTTLTNNISDVAKQAIQSTLDIGDLSIPWWVFVLAVSGILFIINLCVSVCLYKKATNQFNKKRNSKTVHPLHSV